MEVSRHAFTLFFGGAGYRPAADTPCVLAYAPLAHTARCRRYRRAADTRLDLNLASKSLISSFAPSSSLNFCV